MATFENEFDGSLLKPKKSKKDNPQKWAKEVLRQNHKYGLDKTIKLKDFEGKYGKLNAELYLKNTGVWWTEV